MKDLDIRIGIIGAGAAGLSAADALKNKGYTDITILEKDSQPGGKCRSFHVDGRFYELGAGIIVANNHTVHRLAKEFDVEVELIDFSRPQFFYDTATKQETQWISFLETLGFMQQIFLTYRQLAQRYKKITHVGLRGVNEALSVPFSQWAETHKIKLVEKAFGLFFTGFGYGYFDEIPAAYVLKYYSWRTLRSFLKKEVFHFPSGIQSLWRAVAKDQKVLYQLAISKIERTEEVSVKTSQGDLYFDELIVASPLDNALRFLDASAEEKDLFSKIEYCDYRTYALMVNDFPRRDGYVPDNFVSSRKGQPIFWYNRYPDTNVYTFYVLGDWKISDEEVLKNIEELITQLGGSLEGVHSHERWKYFPHVSSEEMRNGYFDRLEALQGKQHTYYVGEALNFSTVEFSAEQAVDLVERFF